MTTVNGNGRQKTTFGERLREERNRLGLSQVKFAELGEQGKHSQINYENDRRSPDVAYLDKIGKAGVDTFYLVTGQRHPAPNLLDLSRRVEQLVGKIHGEDFEAVPRFDVFLAAGDGLLNDEGDPVEHLLFSRPWLRRMGIAPDMGALLTVTGDSMEPLLVDGDLVLVDRDRFDPVSGKVYAFNDPDNGARVKFIDILPEKGGIVLRSANRDHAPDYRTGAGADEITKNIIGQVIWSGHSWK